MKVLTFDLETENHVSNKRKASPFDKRNYIVEAGWNWNGGTVNSLRRDEWHRDDIMKGYHEEFPHYDWNKNKGYPTKAHRQAIRDFGSTDYHRKSFRLLPEQLEIEFKPDPKKKKK